MPNIFGSDIRGMTVAPGGAGAYGGNTGIGRAAGGFGGYGGVGPSSDMMSRLGGAFGTMSGIMGGRPGGGFGGGPTRGMPQYPPYRGPQPPTGMGGGRPANPSFGEQPSQP